MKICCLIVTYNRKKMLVRCINRCLTQSVCPDVMVFDNMSTDGTSEFLQKEGYLQNDRIILHRSDKNGGGSYGFSNGLRLCMEKGYDYVWLLDDDGYPEADNCLQKCIAASEELGLSITNPLVHEGNNLSFKAFGLYKVNELKERYGDKKILIGEVMPFNGTLVSRSVTERIGYPWQDFFVSGDEAEYILRAKKNGVIVATVVDADYFHPSEKTNCIKIPFLNIKISQIPVWRKYCRSRNYMYIAKKYYGVRGILRHCINEIVKCMFQRQDHIKKWKVTIEGFKDGLIENFDLNKLNSYR